MTIDVDAFWLQFERDMIASAVKTFDRRAADARRRGLELLDSDPGAGRILLGTARCLDDCAMDVADLLADAALSSSNSLSKAERIPPSSESSSEANPL